TPVTTHSDIDEPMEPFVKGPGLEAGALVGKVKYFDVIYKPADIVGRPIHPVKMKFGSSVFDFPGTGFVRIDGVVVGLRMYADVHNVLVMPYVFQDIHFAGGGSSTISPVGGKHPYGRPCAPAGWHFGP